MFKPEDRPDQLLQKSAHLLLKDLILIDRTRICLDLIGSALVGWLALYLSTLVSSPLSAAPLFLLSMLASYRSQIFIHEVAHLRARFRSVEAVYNWCVGYMNRAPSYLYYPHSAHHSLKTFASSEDPEYRVLQGSSSKCLFLKVILISAIFPWYKLIRFGVLPLGYPLMSNRFLQAVYQRFATLRFNPKYRRPLRGQHELDLMKREDLRSCAFTWIFILAVAMDLISLKFFLLFQLSTTIGCAVNMYRALLNHRYQSESRHSSLESAMLDSISLKAAWWNELWAPLGLSYHCVHHLMPAIPYYYLRRAHNRLWSNPEIGPLYHKCCENGFFDALRALSDRSAGPEGIAQ